MSSTVVATFTDATKADLAVIALERGGILAENVTVIETDTDDSDAGETPGFYDEVNPYLAGVTRKVRSDSGQVVDASDHTKEAPVYTIVGCIGGCLIGAVLSAALFSIPGYKHLVDAQPIVTFIAGAAIGGILGGSIAALSSSSRKYTELRYYKRVDKEHYVVAVDCTRDQSNAVISILTNQGGDKIKFIPQLSKTSSTKSKRDSLLEQSGFAKH